MGYQRRRSSVDPPPGAAVWELARRQHGVVARQQLLGLGVHPQAIKHRLAKGRLHPVGSRGRPWRGVYGVGRPELTREGRWMAAVLCCGPLAALSHESAAALWRIRAERSGSVHVCAPADGARGRAGIQVHQRSHPREDVASRDRIPVMSPARTLIDLGTCLPRHALEAAVNEADKRDLIDPERLRAAVADRAGVPGAAVLRDVLDRRTFALTDSELERSFLRLARQAGLPPPRTGSYLQGFKVDFHWPELGLVVETDGLRYHRTPAEQARDRIRDQAHARAGLTPLRFTHRQVKHEPAHVVATLGAVSARLRRDAA